MWILILGISCGGISQEHWKIHQVRAPTSCCCYNSSLEYAVKHEERFSGGLCQHGSHHDYRRAMLLLAILDLAKIIELAGLELVEVLQVNLGQ